MRSGTSTGAQVAEANYAKSDADFASKLEGALQELSETKYWFDLLIEVGTVKPTELKALVAELEELTAIIATVVGKKRRAKIVAKV